MTKITRHSDNFSNCPQMSDLQTKAKWSVDEARTYFSKPHVPKKKGHSNKGITQMELLFAIEGIKVEKEYRFNEKRRFRFDFAIPEKKIGIEFEGIMNGKSRHTSVTGYSKDTGKYNLAAAEGWRVFRYDHIVTGKQIGRAHV